MAGAGRRTFQPGEVLTASNVMNYLQDQAVMNFAGTAARGSAIGTAVSEGMVSYRQDSDVIEVYNGSTWKQVYPNFSAGNIVKVYRAQMTATQSFTSTAGGAYTDLTGLSITLTPQSIASTFLIFATAYLTNDTTASGYITNGINISKNTTELRKTYLRQSISNDAASLGSYEVSYLDSPATVSSITYKIGAGQEQTGSSCTVYVNRTISNATLRANSSLTIYEIAG